jgi:hypothetical protein
MAASGTALGVLGRHAQETQQGATEAFRGRGRAGDRGHRQSLLRVLRAVARTPTDTSPLERALSRHLHSLDGGGSDAPAVDLRKRTMEGWHQAVETSA